MPWLEGYSTKGMTEMVTLLLHTSPLKNLGQCPTGHPNKPKFPLWCPKYSACQGHNKIFGILPVYHDRRPIFYCNMQVKQQHVPLLQHKPLHNPNSIVHNTRSIHEPHSFEIVLMYTVSQRPTEIAYQFLLSCT